MKRSPRAARHPAGRGQLARWVLAGVLATVLGICARPARAQLGTDATAFVEVHGFASQGFIYTLENDYLAADTTDGSFEFAEVGLNFTKQITENLRTGIQLFAQDLGPSGNYSANVDWFYLDYTWRDWLGLRFGRLKIPYGLHNEIQDVDAARVPVLLPQSVYPLQTREILFAHTGAELHGFQRLGAAGALDYRLYGGTVFFDAEALTPPNAGFDLDFQVHYTLGGRLLWETPLTGLSVGGSLEKVRFETTAFIPGIEPLVIENRSMLWVASLEYIADDLSLTAEYARWSTKQESNDDLLSPPIDVEDERAYAMAAYRVTDWLQPAAYYSRLIPDVDNRRGRQNYQHDVAATLRFDITPNWLAKVEGHYMIGTAGLLNPLQVNPPDITTAAAHWAAFFLKTTAYF